MKRRDNKGFTLVELLAVITIIGIIAVISIVSVSKLIKKGKDEQKNSQLKTVEMAAESYLQANRSLLPKSIGETTTIHIKSLKSANYLKDDIEDGNGNNCMDKSYVVVSKKSTTEYTYKTYLYCDGDTVPTNHQISVPDIDVKFYALDENGQEIYPSSQNDFLTKVENPKYKITIKGSLNDSSVAVDSYNYSIISNGVEVFSSGTLSANRSATVIIPAETSGGTVSGDLKDYIDVTTVTEVSIIVVARNADGVVYEKKTSLDGYSYDGNEKAKYKDTDPPVCKLGTPEETGEAKDENDWIKKGNYKPRKITVQCTDKGGSGCVRDKFTRTWPNSEQPSAEWSYITVKDNAGNENKTACKVRVNVDVDPPVISIDAHKKGSTDSVFASSVQKSSLGISIDRVNVNDTQYIDLENGWMNLKNYQHGIYYDVTLTDNLYLKSYKWEVNAPNIKTTSDKKYSKYSDAYDDATKEVQITGSTGSCNTSKCTFTIAFLKDGRRQGKLTVKDRAGNEVVYIISANLDRVKPGKPTVTYTTVSDKKKYTKDTWTGQNVVSTPSVVDNDLSGFNRFEFVYIKEHGNKEITGRVTKNGANGKTVEDNGKNKIKYATVDNAGNYSDWSNNNGDGVWVDKEKPSVPTLKGYKTNSATQNSRPTVEITNSSNGWTNTKIYVEATGSNDKKDGHSCSGFKYYKVRATGVTNVSLAIAKFSTSPDKSAGYFNVVNEGISYIYFQACDNVGNCSAEVKYDSKIDTTAPSLPTLIGCSTTGSVNSCGNNTRINSNSWYKNKAAVQVVAGSSKDNLSGVKNFKGEASGATTQGLGECNIVNVTKDGTTTVGFTACDWAGNCNSGRRNFVVKLDNQKPSGVKVTVYKKTSSNNVSGNPGHGTLNKDGEWYKGWAVTVASGATDPSPSSGGLKYYYTTSGTTSADTDKAGSHRNINSQGSSSIVYKVCDKVGNCSTATSDSKAVVRLDRTDPKCGTVSKSNTGSQSGVTVSVGCSDSYSGCGQKTYSRDNRKSSSSITISDKVGNTKDCSYSVTSYDCNPDTCGGQAYTCYKRQLIASGVNYYYCYVTLGGDFRQDGGYSINHGGIGNCYKNVARTCYKPTYYCNWKTCYK